MKIAGFGFRKNANADSMLAAFEAVGAAGVTHIATVDSKACLAFTELGDRLALPVRLVPEESLGAAQVTTRSSKSIEMYGTGSLSEAVALIAAGEGARLVATRVMSEDRMATCAIAEGHDR